MDPNANLKEQRDTAWLICSGIDHMTADQLQTNALHLAQLVIALDEWLRNGGFLPERWKP